MGDNKRLFVAYFRAYLCRSHLGGFFKPDESQAPDATNFIFRGSYNFTLGGYQIYHDVGAGLAISSGEIFPIGQGRI